MGGALLESIDHRKVFLPFIPFFFAFDVLGIL
jgi:hypothetical protein